MLNFKYNIGRGEEASPSTFEREVTPPLSAKKATAPCHDSPAPIRTDGVPISKKLRVAIAGNPNAGKSSLFNALTGGHQHVGNWPGKTVERKVGSFAQDGVDIELIDLPGTYSLSAYSAEEIIARDFIIDEKPDAVICVVDASNLERNLYLTVQLLELGVPVIVALNMSDQAAARGLQINADELSKSLAAPIVPTVGSRGLGIDDLRAEVMKLSDLGASTFAPLHSASSQWESKGSCH